MKITEIASKFEEMERNGVLLSQRNAMRIIQMRIQQLAERIDLNDAPERMKKIETLWREYRELDGRGSQLEAKLVAIQIDAEFEAAYHDYMAWEQMFTALDLHKKMTESEAKIIKDMRAVLTAEDATLLMAKVMSVLLDVLKDDPQRLKAAQYGLTRIITETGRRIGSGSGEGRSEAGPGELDRGELLYPGDEERSYIERTPEIGGLPQGRDTGSVEPGGVMGITSIQSSFGQI